MRLLGVVLAFVLALVPAMQAGPARAQPGPWMMFFERGKDEITPQAMQNLRNVAEAYHQHRPAQITIGGHTATIGEDGANVGLSQRRANRVRDALAAMGVPAGVMTTQAFGESLLLAETADGVAEPQNDRVEIEFGAAAAAAQAVDDDRYGVFFLRGQDAITPQAMDLLQSAIKRYGERSGVVRVHIAGHTARIGDAAANLALSQRRARHVRYVLIASGVPEDMITVESYGESRPLVETADGVAEPQNDRVELTLGSGRGW